jgi:hypothetical protein
MISTVVTLWAEQPRILGLIPDRGKRFFFLLLSIQTLTLGPTQPFLQYVLGPLFWGGGINQPGMKLTTHLSLVPWLKLSGSLPPLPYALYVVHRGIFTFTLICSGNRSVDNILKQAEGFAGCPVGCFILSHWIHFSVRDAK